MNARPLQGVLMVLAAALCWGTTGTAQSFAPPTLPSVWVGALRLLASAAFFAAVLALSRRSPGLRRAGAWPLLAAGLSMAAYNLAFFAGVRASGVAVGTAVALGSGPIWAGLLQALRGQAPTARWWAGTALAVIGGVVMVLGQQGEHARPMDMAGLLLCLAAGLSYAVYALVNQQLVARADPSGVTMVVFSIAAAVAVPAAALVAGAVSLSTRDLLIAAYLGVVATGIAYLLFSHALRHISGATGVTLALAEPVTAFALAVIVIGERPGWAAAGGGLLVLAGLAVVVWSELRTKPAS